MGVTCEVKKMIKDYDFLYSALNGPSKTQLEIFVVEDDHVFGGLVVKYLEKKLTCNVHSFSSPVDCVEYLESGVYEQNRPFVLVSDISFNEGGADGLLLIDLLKEKNFEFVSIAMTGFASIETAIKATKKGVFHYLTKPFELNVLKDLVVKAAVEKLSFSRNDIITVTTDKELPRVQMESNFNFKIEAPIEEDIFCGMIGRSRAMKSVFERISKVADSATTVLITGPSGTGKELVANAIHKLSERSSKRMVSVNCGAIPSELLESELFGHEKGSFTGAVSSKVGRFELAQNGTIFLDEIGDMPLLLQVKLLRVLQERKIERVGGVESLPIDVRIVTATHRNLEQAVQDKIFREDLYYRLNVIPIIIPPLSERREDIPLLISYFLSRFVSADGRNQLDFERETLEILMSYDWPGNVRELENLMERLVILRGGNIVRPSDLPTKFLRHSSAYIHNYSDLISLPEEGLDLKRVLSDLEDSLINQALKKTSGNKNQASKLLSMNRTTLIEKLKKKGLFGQNLSL